MKQILLTLVALCATMSIKAQTIEIYADGNKIATYNNTSTSFQVVFKQTPIGRGTTIRTGGVYVNWVQLWEDGPKFAEYNIGAAYNKAEDDGNYYTWGGSKDQDQTDYNTGSETLSGNNDTATKLWGSNWRMPTTAEFEALLNPDNCTFEWKENYNNKGVNGLLFTGKGAYENNSVFLPAAGEYNGEYISMQNIAGYYWSSNTKSIINSAECLVLYVSYVIPQIESYYPREYGKSVRAVLAE